MKRLVYLILLAAVGVTWAMGGSSRGRWTEGRFEQSIPAAGISVLKARTNNGSISVVGAAGAREITLVAIKRARARSSENEAELLAQVTIEVETSGDEIEILI